MRAALLAAALVVASPASPAAAACDPDLERTVVTPDDVRARGGPGLRFEPGDVLETPLDGDLLCPDRTEGTACVVDGPIRAACTVLRAGVAIDDVTVNGPIDLRDAAVLGDIAIGGGASSSIDLSGIDVTGHLALDAWRLGELAIRDATIGGAVRLAHVTSEGDVSLSGTFVAGDVELGDVRAASIDLSVDSVVGLRARRVTASASLVADRIDVAMDVVFETVQVAGDLELLGVSGARELRLAGVTTSAGLTIKGRIAQRLAIDGLSAEADLDVFDSQIGSFELRWSRVGGDVLVDRSTIVRDVAIDGVEIRGDLDVERSAVTGSVEILRSRFGGLVFLSNEARARVPRIVDCTPADPLAPPPG